MKRKFAIVTRPDYRSPRILAESLQYSLREQGAVADLFFNISCFTRLNSFQSSKGMAFHFWLYRKLRNYWKDKLFIRTLKKYDVVIISECTPNGFWKHLYHIEQLRNIIKKPIWFLEVYYLGNAPTQIVKLQKEGHPTIERYDKHLCISPVTEIKQAPNPNWLPIGLNLQYTGLKPNIKEKFIALVDFVQPGYEAVQAEQIAVLNALNIETIVLNQRYTINEIRAIYQQAAVFFIQFPEAFGMPIAECLACGVQIFTPNSGWPMSWRLNNNPEIHGEGILGDCFTVYDSENDLKQKLTSFITKFHISNTPHEVFQQFLENYSTFFFGNSQNIKSLIV
ncbi:MAG: glycosyltransferase [Chitinophagaceae bacterium]